MPPERQTIGTSEARKKGVTIVRNRPATGSKTGNHLVNCSFKTVDLTEHCRSIYDNAKHQTIATLQR